MVVTHATGFMEPATPKPLLKRGAAGEMPARSSAF
jgi:hypothetical protein